MSIVDAIFARHCTELFHAASSDIIEADSPVSFTVQTMMLPVFAVMEQGPSGSALLMIHVV